jgi:tetratricopeptide (TPR) repeat protein
MKNLPNNSMKDLHRLLAKQEFQTEDDVKAFMNSLMGKPIPMMSPQDLTPEEQAEDIVAEAQDLPPAQARKKIQEALALDPDCIDAYVALGSLEAESKAALKHLEKGVAIGRRKFFGENAEEYAGHFWGMTETRPFMRCMHLMGECLLTMGTPKSLEQGLAIYEEMLTLNPNDNQGIRDMFLLFCIIGKKYDTFAKYDAQFDDGTAFCAFNRALCAFCSKGDTENARALLEQANTVNPYVIPKLLTRITKPVRPEYYGMGDENEAHYYILYAYPFWQTLPGVAAWLRKNAVNFAPPPPPKSVKLPPFGNRR